MILWGLGFCFVGSMLLMFATGLLWWKGLYYSEQLSPWLQSGGFIALFVGFALQIASQLVL